MMLTLSSRAVGSEITNNTAVFLFGFRRPASTGRRTQRELADRGSLRRVGSPVSTRRSVTSWCPLEGPREKAFRIPEQYVHPCIIRDACEQHGACGEMRAVPRQVRSIQDLPLRGVFHHVLDDPVYLQYRMRRQWCPAPRGEHGEVVSNIHRGQFQKDVRIC